MCLDMVCLFDELSVSINLIFVVMLPLIFMIRQSGDGATKVTSLLRTTIILNFSAISL